MTAVVLDTETTGFDEPQVIELSCTALLPEKLEGVRASKCTTKRFKPTKPISLGAKAAHGITEEDLQDFDPWPGSWLPIPGTKYIIGHNVDYDWRALGSPDVERICTLAISRYTWPSIDSHSLGAMMYHLFPAKAAQQATRKAHSARADVLMTVQLLQRLLAHHFPEGFTWAQVHTLSEKARIPLTMPFGKYKGRPIAEVPLDYRSWLLRQDDVDPYLFKALTT